MFFPPGETAAQWYSYGMIWSKGSVAYYVDNPTQPYATFTLSSISGSVRLFDNGPKLHTPEFDHWGKFSGFTNSGTPFPSQMLVDYVRTYTN